MKNKNVVWKNSNGGPGVYCAGDSFSASVKPWLGGQWRWIAATNYSWRSSGSGESDTIEAAQDAAEEFINAG